jgi:hypothetical protein
VPDDTAFNAVPGARIAQYVLDERLGSGGFGTVWRARDPETGQLVAIKVLHDRYAGEDARRARAEIEAVAAAAASRSEHVVRVLGGGMQPVPHIVMEYVEGTNLRDEIARRGRLSQRETVRVGRAIADALAAAEAEGIVHRDVKSANVLLDLDRAVRLGDFGTAKIAGYSSGSVLGQAVISKEYSAPEIWNFLEATTRSDLYSLGVVLFECLAGRPPFTGSMAECKLQHETREPDYGLLPADTIEPLRRLIAGCLEKDPAGRTASGVAVVDALDDAERALRVAPQQKHEPTSLEHWVIHSRHPSRPWTFRCVHDTTGQRATVEVHFADDPAYARVLEQARGANAALIPLGAERLLGANRLLLRTDEEWPELLPAHFMFWVAREELPVPRSPGSVDMPLLATAVDGLGALREAAAAQGLDLQPDPGDLALLSDGSLHLQRPGLPPAGPPGDVWMLAFLASLPLEPGARETVAAATSLEELRNALDATTVAGAPPEEPLPGPEQPIPVGHAVVIDDRGGLAPEDVSDQSSIVGPSLLPDPPESKADFVRRPNQRKTAPAPNALEPPAAHVPQLSRKLRVIGIGIAGVFPVIVVSAAIWALWASTDSAAPPKPPTVAATSSAASFGTSGTPTSEQTQVAVATVFQLSERIAFHGPSAGGGTDIFVGGPPSTPARAITSGGNTNAYPSWSPDGNRLVFASDRDGLFALYIVNANGTGLQRASDEVGHDEYPAWSPDGDLIAFASNRSRTYEIYTARPDGSGLTQLTHDSGVAIWPAWSPDGRQLAFESERDGPRDIYVMNRDGSGIINLTHSAALDREPVWSRDGKRIYFSSRQAGKYVIRSIAPDGSDERLALEGADDLREPATGADNRTLLVTALTSGAVRYELRGVVLPGAETLPLWPSTSGLRASVVPAKVPSLSR